MTPSMLALAAIAALLLLAIPFVAVIRHRDEKPLAAYLMFAVSFSASACSFFFFLLMLARAWPEVIDVSSTGAFTLSVLPAMLIGLWFAGRRPCKSPSLSP